MGIRQDDIGKFRCFINKHADGKLKFQLFQGRCHGFRIVAVHHVIGAAVNHSLRLIGNAEFFGFVDSQRIKPPGKQRGGKKFLQIKGLGHSGFSARVRLIVFGDKIRRNDQPILGNSGIPVRSNGIYPPLPAGNIDGTHQQIQQVDGKTTVHTAFVGGTASFVVDPGRATGQDVPVDLDRTADFSGITEFTGYFADSFQRDGADLRHLSYIDRV